MKWIYVLDPPRDVRLTSNYVEVYEDQFATPVKCSGNGRPSLNYVWKNKNTHEIVTKSETLSLGPMTKSLAGTYTCTAWNKHGNESTNVDFYLYCMSLINITNQKINE